MHAAFFGAGAVAFGCLGWGLGLGAGAVGFGTLGFPYVLILTVLAFRTSPGIPVCIARPFRTTDWR